MAIADSGVFEEHEEFRGRFDSAASGSCANGGLFRPGEGSWRPSRAAASAPTHGTQVASVAAAGSNGVGIQGVAPQATVVAIRVGNDDGDFFPEATICAAMTAVHQRLPIVNYSFGVDYVGQLRAAFWDPAKKDQAADVTAVRRAFVYSTSHGVLNVIATGNAGQDDSDKPSIPLPASESHKPPYSSRLRDLPGQMPGTLGVGEVYDDGTIAGSSTSGFEITDIVSVGSGLMAGRPNRYTHDAGTSFAAPAVAGAAALVKQILPNATPKQITALLYASATARSCRAPGTLYSEQPCRTRKHVTNYFGHGQLDALAAVQLAIQRGSQSDDAARETS